MTTPTVPPVLGCRDVTKSFGTQPVLSKLSLTVEPGRVYALLGPNGAGKSTTLKIMLGLLAADSGQAFLMRRPWTRESLAHVGASVEGPALYQHLSATDNLRVHARLTGVPDSRVHDVLAIVGLSGVGRKRARSFSTGMKGRLALAIALLTDPQILVLDEPQNGLDPEGVIELRRLIRTLAGQGRTVLISSHQLGEVTQLADDIGVLARGQLVYQGPIEQFADGDLEQAYLSATTGARS
jgi:ABC-2 type transport system ATP-binding protein